MICKCGASAKQHTLSRGDNHARYWEYPACGRELADGRAAELLDEKFNWQRVGWYQNILKPLPFLTTKTRMYDLRLLRTPTDYVAPIQGAKKYLHGLIEADGNMIFNQEENR